MSKITKSAKDKHCTVRIPGVCNYDASTTVLAHLNGGGMGKKHNDIHGAYCCSSCHDVLDGRVKSEWPAEMLKLWHLEAVIKSQIIMLEEGVISA